MKQDVEKDTTSANNRENGGLRANEVNESCPGLVPRESPVEERAPEPSALHMHEQEASSGFLALSHLPHTQGSQWARCVCGGGGVGGKGTGLSGFSRIMSPSLPLQLPRGPASA